MYVPTVGLINCSLFPAQFSQICCQSSEINLLTHGKNSEAGSFIGVTASERAAFADLNLSTVQGMWMAEWEQYFHNSWLYGNLSISYGTFLVWTLCCLVTLTFDLKTGPSATFKSIMSYVELFVLQLGADTGQTNRLTYIHTYLRTYELQMHNAAS